jgi:receptor expression-enhancing protein 1/2/3/4
MITSYPPVDGLFFSSHPTATFKALRQRPLNEQELEKWASYWTVVGILVAFEYTAEWLLSW